MDITQYIDLESYSSTPGFLGYTDNAPDFSEAGIDALCDRFLEKMAAHIGDVTVVSSLFINSNKEELSQDYDIPFTDIDKFLHALLKNGLVKNASWMQRIPESVLLRSVCRCNPAVPGNLPAYDFFGCHLWLFPLLEVFVLIKTKIRE